MGVNSFCPKGTIVMTPQNQCHTLNKEDEILRHITFTFDLKKHNLTCNLFIRLRQHICIYGLLLLIYTLGWEGTIF